MAELVFPNCGKCGLPLKKKELDSGFHDACKTVVLPGQISFAEQDRSFVPIDQWSGCYPSNWKGTITEESFAHPAKFSSKLIRKIYEHMVAEGWLPVGSVVIDPFGGVALGALFAMQNGCSWVGCELEERFVEMGNDNIALWNNKFSVMPKWSGSAVLLQGDSRFLSQVLSGANAVVDSPPYADVPLVPFMQGEDAGKLRVNRGQAYSAAVSSPPFSDTLSLDTVNASDRRALARAQGIDNAEHISPIDMEKIGKRSQEKYAAAVSSPPYADGSQHTGGDDLHPERMDGGTFFGVGINGVVSSPPYADSINSENGIDASKTSRHGKNSQAEQVTRYGTRSAQLGAAKATDKGFQAAVSSPPFLQTSGGVNVTSLTGALADPAVLARHAAGNSNVGYGDTEGNMGSVSPDDFWISARQIIEQVFQVLEPGGRAVWVCKDYIKGGKRIEFCRMWMELCEAVGFVALHEHHATLVREQGVSTTKMDGEEVSLARSSKSFFRRMAEKKGSPPIDFETVFCMVKPI